VRVALMHHLFAVVLLLGVQAEECEQAPHGEYVVEGWKRSVLASISRDTLATWEEHDAKLHEFVKAHIPSFLAHTGAAPFDSHLRGVQTILRMWGARDEMGDAGLFHSIYGTEGFQGYKYPLEGREKIRDLIGSRAERLVWIFCMVDRATIDSTLNRTFDAHAEEHSPDKFSGFVARPELGRFALPLIDVEEWYDFLELTLADLLEQIEGAASKANPAFEWEVGEAFSYRRQAYHTIFDILHQHRGVRLDDAKRMMNDIYGAEDPVHRHKHQLVTPATTPQAKEAREATSIGLKEASFVRQFQTSTLR